MTFTSIVLASKLACQGHRRTCLAQTHSACIQSNHRAQVSSLRWLGPPKLNQLICSHKRKVMHPTQSPPLVRYKLIQF